MHPLHNGAEEAEVLRVTAVLPNSEILILAARKDPAINFKVHGVESIYAKNI